MKFVNIYIFLHLFLVLFKTTGQNVPWVVQPTSVSHSVNIGSATITVDDEPISNGDAVGLFYDSLGTLACGGFAVWPAVQIIAYGNDSGEPNGFELDEAFKFKIWKKKDNCIIDSGTIVQFQYEPPVYNDSIYFKEGGTSKMITLNGAKKNIFYTKNTYCLSDPNPVPVKQGTFKNLVFTSQAGLVLNSVTGSIDIAASQPGTYVVYFQTDLCIKNTSATLSIQYNIENLDVSAIPPDCKGKGIITINESTIICGIPPYQYRVRNIISGVEKTSTFSTIEELPDGSYELFIKDASGTELKYKNLITLSKKCKDLIIAPYSSEHASYFIPLEGTTRIYDRFGLLVRQLETPADWNATDNSGNLVPAGQYLIICNEKERIVLSVIK